MSEQRMDFVGAVGAMNDGFRVAREGWMDPKYIYWASEHKQQAASKYVKQVNGRFKANNNRKMESFFHPTNMLAKDWIIVGETEEKKKSNKSYKSTVELVKQLRRSRNEKIQKHIQQIREKMKDCKKEDEATFQRQIKELEGEWKE